MNVDGQLRRVRTSNSDQGQGDKLEYTRGCSNHEQQLATSMQATGLITHAKRTT